MNPSSTPDSRVLSPEGVECVLAAVAQLRGIDFRDYRRETIVRGISARLDEHPELDVESYSTRLQTDQREITRLLETLVIPCSSFFRDAAVFTALEKEVLPKMAFSHLEQRPLRAWCVGVATGEEAWSLAMLLAKICEGPAGPDWQLLASDIDERTLRIAEEGRYPSASAADIPQRLRERFLVGGRDSVEIAPSLRQRVRFSRHDLLGARLAPVDAVVASFDLVLCRNVLIYFDRRLQEKALERLAATLEPDGVLVLGQVETLPDSLESQLQPYPALDTDLRIFTQQLPGRP